MDENTKNELESLGVNVEAAVSRFAGKSERYIKYLKMHVMTGYFSKLGDALKEGNVSDAQLFSHTLKGDFKNFEFGSLTDTMVSLNDQLKEGSMDGAMDKYESMINVYDNITEIIVRLS